MSTNVLPDRAATSTAPRPAAGRIRGLTWVVLRQNRALLRTMGALLVLAAADLLWIHIASQHTIGILRRTGCYSPASWNSTQCWTLLAPINRPTFWYMQVLQPVVTAIPLLVGVFVGAPMIAQEHERGTIRLIRSQSVHPLRWLAVRLAVPGLAVLATTGVIAALMSWVWWTDVVHGPIAFDPPFQFFTYPALGPAPVAWSLFALAVGALLGQLLRRTLPAMFVTAATVGAAFGAMSWARRYLYPITDKVVPLHEAQPTNAWLIDHGVVMADGTRVNDEVCISADHACDGATASWIKYHPSADLVPVQLVEAGILLALTAAVLVTVFRLARK
ncbi:hypothetical protein ACFXDE_18680 [Kitasatospora sp. NPDC059408]|uniref:hypothetical protein n=1 Tax=Kitasatospora sp. NPDC059408 TaxID=3346823 RepID=UPI00367A0161